MHAEAARKGIPDKLVVTARHQNCINCGGALSDSSKEAWVLSVGNIHKCIFEEQEWHVEAASWMEHSILCWGEVPSHPSLWAPLNLAFEPGSSYLRE
jgi:hypothetical protein